MTARTGDCRARSSASKVEPVHDRHVDVEQQQLDIGLLRQHRQRLLAVAGEAEVQVLGADALPKALPDQGLEVGLVIDGQDLGRPGHTGSR